MQLTDFRYNLKAYAMLACEMTQVAFLSISMNIICICHLAVAQKVENRFVLILATSFVMLDLFCPYPIRGEVQKLTTGWCNLHRSSFQICAN